MYYCRRNTGCSIKNAIQFRWPKSVHFRLLPKSYDYYISSERFGATQINISADCVDRFKVASLSYATNATN